MMKKISILGCGWLGLSLAEFLIQKDYEVKGSTTSEEKLCKLSDKGIQPYLIKLDPYYKGSELSDFLKSDLLIINIPPSLRKQSEEFHVEQMEELNKYIAFSPIKNILYISSTSVYPDLNREVIEEDVTRIEEADNKTLFRAEEIFRRGKDIKNLIIRCAGLAGYDRNLAKHFAGKKDLKMGNAPVNLIHRDDVIGIIYFLLQKNIWNETYNISAPIHPLRKELYPYLAERYGYALPGFDPFDHTSFKVISSKKIFKDLAYEFKYPDPKSFFYQNNLEL